MKSRLLFLSLASAFSCSLALGDSADPPETVGRVALIEGTVTVHGDASPAAEAIELNWPLIAGDRLETGARSRAELYMGSAHLWVDQDSVVTIVELSANSIRLKVEGGSLRLRLAGAVPASSVRIDTAAAALDLDKPGDYRVDLHNGETILAVLTGAARIGTETARFEQFGGEEAAVAPDGTVHIREPISSHSLDRWVSSRPRKHGNGKSEPHLPPRLVGQEELDGQGTWQWEPEYGMVWEPRSIRREWAPYRFGHWIWKSPWGWTWVDDAPWGFATTHYGRWTRIDGHWKWIPGARQLDAVFAPALVEWIEDQDDQTLIGWFPLEAREEYVPPYPASSAYTCKLNTFTTVSARKVAADAVDSSSIERPRAVTWTRRSAFAGHALPSVREHLASQPSALSR